jgi:hypothetical protein
MKLILRLFSQQNKHLQLQLLLLLLLAQLHTFRRRLLHQSRQNTIRWQLWQMKS